MRQLIEEITAAETAAVEALLNLAGLRYNSNIQRNFDETNSSLQPSQEQPQQQAKTIVTSTPNSLPFKKRVYIPPVEEQPSKVLSINFNGFIEKCGSLSPVLNESSASTVAASTKGPTTKLTRSIPVRPNSGRVIKRTRRFISESDEEADFQNDARKLSTPGKTTKSTSNKDTLKNTQKDKDVIHPAKKLKTESVCEEKEQKVVDKDSSTRSSTGSSGSNKKNEPSTKLKRDLFNTNIMEVIQSDEVRHSRLFEAAYELQNCTTPDANVEFQYRAVENLIEQKDEIVKKRNQFSTNRSSKAMELMQKFRSIKNRQQVCNEFSSKFGPTKSAEWKPFTEDPSRSTDISNYRALQMTKKPCIKFWIDQFLTQNRDKGKSRSMLIEIVKMLPNRPEARHKFISGHLSKLLTAQKQANKKNKKLAVKAETVDINAALP